jgi:hypothetical protein
LNAEVLKGNSPDDGIGNAEPVQLTAYAAERVPDDSASVDLAIRFHQSLLERRHSRCLPTDIISKVFVWDRPVMVIPFAGLPAGVGGEEAVTVSFWCMEMHVDHPRYSQTDFHGLLPYMAVMLHGDRFGRLT